MDLLWHDLLGIPWKLHGTTRSGMDCSTIAETVLRRLGHSPPKTSAFRRNGSAGEQNEMTQYLDSLAINYDRIGSELSDAQSVGDIVLSKDSTGISRHMYVLVEPKRSTFLTATHNRGVVAVRPYMINQVSGVYRIKEDKK